MHKTNHNNTEEDNFRRIIKGKLEGYSLPAGNDIWNKIEKSLDKEHKKERRIALWPWISGTAVAAAVALFALALHLVGDKHFNYETTYETTDAVSEYAETIDKNVPVKTVNQPVSASSIQSERIFIPRKTKGEYAEVCARPETNVNNTSKGDIVSGKEPEDPFSISKGQMKNAQTKQEKPNPQEKVVFPNIDPFGDDDLSSAKNTKKRKTLNLSVGSGNNLMAMNTNDKNVHVLSNGVIGELRSSLYEDIAESKTQERLLFEDFPKATHRPPLSFGLTVKKELNRTFSLETGFVYTFLDSRFENRDLERKALLQLHYLGIPVNIQAQIWGNKQSDWGIYLSAGGMVEKGIYSHYKQTNHASGSSLLTIVSNEKIDGLQYSVSFAPGIDYKIYRNYSVYLEPKISYYFDNNQPVSARTKHPVVIGVNAGIRLCW